MNPFETRQLGRTKVAVPRLGLGTAPLGGWPSGVSHEQGIATVRRAWDRGIRYFDTAPFYGYGKAEEFVGAGLDGHDRKSFRLSTKVGRLLEPGAVESPLYLEAHPFTPVFDFSAAAVAKSLDESGHRLRISRPDIALIHDPDDHHAVALLEAYPTLREMKTRGEIGAIGVGMNHVDPLVRFAREADFDCFLLAGRYTLLEQTALDELFPLATERGVSIIAGGVFNSGLLVDPSATNPTYDYAAAPAPLIEAAKQLASVCAKFDVPLRAAAIQFAAAHPAVATVVIGARSPAEVDDTLAMASLPIPSELWVELRSCGFIRADAPTPRG